MRAERRPSGEMAALVSAVYPEVEDEPYRQVEYLLNRGFELIGDRTTTISAADDQIARRLSDLVDLLD